MQLHFFRLSWYAVIASSFISFSCEAAETKPATNTPAFYRLAQLDDAKKRATAEAKPIAWIASYPEYLTPHAKPMGKAPHSASTYAFLAFQKETIIVFSDARAENHQEPGIVDQALHTPEGHYTVPCVIVLIPSLEKIICKLPYTG